MGYKMQIYQILAQTAALILCGVVWRQLRPYGLDTGDTRRVLSNVVYGLLLPALVLRVLWRVPLGLDVLKVSFVAVCAISAALLVAWGWYRLQGIDRPAVGALLLAAAFGNVTYLGLPVLESVLGPGMRHVALEFDLFASTPLLLTVGVLLARHYGGLGKGENPLLALIKVPPVLAALAAVGLNITGVPLHPWLEGVFDKLASGVVPLMLVVVGLGLEWKRGWARRLVVLIPALVIQMLLMPLWVWGLGLGIGLSGDLLVAVVLEGAMPCMLLGIVICERYGLDTPLYAEAVTVSTGLAAVTLPAWYHWLT
jgi:predicted permease